MHANNSYDEHFRSNTTKEGNFQGFVLQIMLGVGCQIFELAILLEDINWTVVDVKRQILLKTAQFCQHVASNSELHITLLCLLTVSESLIGIHH